MEAISPVIQDGALVLTSSGDLKYALDIQTQAATALTAYNWPANLDVNSLLLPYIQQGLIKTSAKNTITQIIKNAYTPLINAKIISNLQISVNIFNISSVMININLTDNNGDQVLFSWNNIQ